MKKTIEAATKITREIQALPRLESNIKFNNSVLSAKMYLDELESKADAESHAHAPPADDLDDRTRAEPRRPPSGSEPREEWSPVDDPHEEHQY